MQNVLIMTIDTCRYALLAQFPLQQKELCALLHSKCIIQCVPPAVAQLVRDSAIWVGVCWVQSHLRDKREETQNPMYVPNPYMWNPVFIQTVQWFQPLDDSKKYPWIVNITPILLSALLNATFILYLTVLCRPSLNSRVFSIWEILGISLAVGSIISMVTKPWNHVCKRRQQTVHPCLGNPMTQFSTT